MRRADARTRLHGDDAFNRHRHVNHHAVAFLHAAGSQGVGKAAHPFEQLPVGDVRDGAIVRFEDHRDMLAVTGFDVAVEAVVGSVEGAVVEPFIERRARFIENRRKRLFPLERLARETAPEPGVVTFSLGDQRAVGVHAGDRGVSRHTGVRKEGLRLLQNRIGG